jgi:hypothetical protein
MTLPRKKKVHYVNNKTLYEEMIKYKDMVAAAQKAGATELS